jgi:acetoin:2,6-dichlorophenolindophenol oxidoreductase subunit beta
VPLDVHTVLRSLERTGRVVTIEENPRALGWGAELCSILVEEAFDALDGPIMRVTTEPIPLPATPSLERMARPSVERTLETIRKI